MPTRTERWQRSLDRELEALAAHAEALLRMTQYDPNKYPDGLRLSDRNITAAAMHIRDIVCTVRQHIAEDNASAAALHALSVGCWHRRLCGLLPKARGFRTQRSLRLDDALEAAQRFDAYRQEHSNGNGTWATGHSARRAHRHVAEGMTADGTLKVKPGSEPESAERRVRRLIELARQESRL